ncbi:nickel-dependent hydrogenase large subunit [Hippea jasoniae]|uniref:nickel-dependent hydrogenase large subunit n=1 Tax=Hippea jasoniae TaxID=944479 RepID=UPI000557B2CB|nr:nickel-dependent hydrogenase large subunit [Hippea jasoniae]
MADKKHLVIDPITRIEGHLRIEVDIKDGKVVNSWSSGTLWRGIEPILQGRDIRDAGLLVQRICGVCTWAHYEANTMSAEVALKIRPPTNARLIRNMINATQFMHDHIVHFYALHSLDWADVAGALKADPVKASELAHQFSKAPYNASVDHYKAVIEKLKKFVSSGQLGPFSGAYLGNKLYKLPPEGDLIVISHYLDALYIQVILAQMMAIYGAKNPHPQSLVVGGITSVMDMLDARRLGEYTSKLDKVGEFIQHAYLADIDLITHFYKDEFVEGWGCGSYNFLSYGGFPETNDWEAEYRYLPQGVIFNRDLTTVEKVDEKFITESIAHSWYKGPDKGLYPGDEQTVPEYTGLNSDGTVKGEGKYSWVKAPRYKGKMMEVGPLSRQLVGYALNHNNMREMLQIYLNKHNANINQMFSTVGRTAARALETAYIWAGAYRWVDDLVKNLKQGDERTWTRFEYPEKETNTAVALYEAPRGSLAHFVRIKGKNVTHYQVVVPSTWNASPRDEKGQRGAYEESLINLPVPDPEEPLEVLRTIHSFDPCLACAVHLVDVDSGKVRKFKVEV